MQEKLLEQQYIFRSYIPSKDIPNLSHLLTLVENYDHDGEDTSEISLKQQLSWRNHIPEQDCWVIEKPGDSQVLIGYCSVYAQTTQRCTLYAAIHPEFRRHGLASVLLKKAMSRAREIGATQVILYVNAHNATTNAFLKKQQFQLVGSSWILQTLNTLVLPKIFLPSGYTLSSYATIQNIGALLNVINHSYADLWGHAENTQATEETVLQEWLTNADPESIFLVFAPNGEIAGFCRANRAKRSQGSEFSDNMLLDEIEQPA